MDIGYFAEEFPLDEFETLEKTNRCVFGFLERLFVVLGYEVDMALSDDDRTGIRRITATYRKIDP